MAQAPLVIDGNEILPGTNVKFELPVAKLYTDSDVSLPIHVFRAKKPGPTILLLAGVHGDEVNGVAIVRKIIKLKYNNPKRRAK